MTSLTERYLAVALRGIPERQPFRRTRRTHHPRPAVGLGQTPS